MRLFGSCRRFRKRKILAETGAAQYRAGNWAGRSYSALVRSKSGDGCFSRRPCHREAEAIFETGEKQRLRQRSAGGLRCWELRRVGRRRGTAISNFRKGRRPGDRDAAPVKSFREKPVLKVAKQYVTKGNFYWNAGMFFLERGDRVAKSAHASSQDGYSAFELARVCG